MQRKPRKPKPIKVLPGLLDLLVLQALGNRRLRTRAIARRIFETTEETFSVQTASLLPCLERLKVKKFIYREKAPTGRIVYYRLSRPGRQRLKAELRRWKRIRDGIEAATHLSLLGKPGEPDYYEWVPTVSPRRVAYGDFDNSTDGAPTT